jgi:glycolate oxidase iron-sulfur subunit
VTAPAAGIFPEELLRTCISCGFCLSACPTYQDTRREASSPRGRINLMRALERGELVAGDLEEELSFCLGCRACETVCPAGVRYGALLELARDAVGTPHDPRLRALLWAVSSPGRTSLAGRLMRTGQGLGLTRLAPGGMRAAAASAPRIEPARRRALRRSVGPADGEPCALFLGCVGQLVFSGTAHAAAAALALSGRHVTTPPEQGCCGALHAHNGDLDGARRLAGGLVAAFAGSDGPGGTCAGGCGAFMADYGELLGGRAATAFAARVRDVSQLLSERPPPVRDDLPRLRVAYQDSCHLRNGQGVTAEPRALLRALPGVELVDGALAGRCCGAAGTYGLLRPDDSLAFLAPKLDEIAAAGVDAIVSGNPGCLLQFRQGAARAGLTGVRVLHTVELVAERMAEG